MCVTSLTIILMREIHAWKREGGPTFCPFEKGFCSVEYSWTEKSNKTQKAAETEQPIPS